MKKVYISLIGLLLLAGCGGKGESGGQSSAARLDGKEKGSEFLAYEHNVSVDTNEAQVRPLYEQVVAACKATRTTAVCCSIPASTAAATCMRASACAPSRPASRSSSRWSRPAVTSPARAPR